MPGHGPLGLPVAVAQQDRQGAALLIRDDDVEGALALDVVHEPVDGGVCGLFGHVAFLVKRVPAAEGLPLRDPLLEGRPLRVVVVDGTHLLGIRRLRSLLLAGLPRHYTVRVEPFGVVPDGFPQLGRLEFHEVRVGGGAVQGEDAQDLVVAPRLRPSLLRLGLAPRRCLTLPCIFVTIVDGPSQARGSSAMQVQLVRSAAALQMRMGEHLHLRYRRADGALDVERGDTGLDRHRAAPPLDLPDVT
mmetsp:Transcript_17827/g.50486  ORF Transcript_17827/g.50486 Transcript_17827/m.50486 type:complete len:245 (-) Transcript_17827:538-1272(-)